MPKLKTIKHYSITVLFATVFASSCFAADIPPPPTLSQSLPDEKDIPSSVPKTDEEPEVTIIKKNDATIEEVRVRGKLRYAKITPKIGKPYYLYDSNGDGILDASVNEVDQNDINQWILMEW